MDIPQQYVPDIVAAAQQWSVPAPMLAAQLEAESGFNPTARSSAGALGIAQFLPGTARQYGVNPWDPRSSIFGAAHYDSDLFKRFGDWTKALEAYNVGPDGPLESAAGYAAGILNRAIGLAPTRPGSSPSSSSSAAPGRCTPTGWQPAKCAAADVGCGLTNAWGSFACAIKNLLGRLAAGFQILLGLLVIAGGVAILAYLFMTRTATGRQLAADARSAAKTAALAAV